MSNNNRQIKRLCETSEGSFPWRAGRLRDYRKFQSEPTFKTFFGGGIHMRGLHADDSHRGEKKKKSLRPVPWPSEPAHPHYWLSSSCQSHWGWWEAAESSRTRSPWSPQSLPSNRCGRRLSAACAWGSCGNALWPSQARSVMMSMMSHSFCFFVSFFFSEAQDVWTCVLLW